MPLLTPSRLAIIVVSLSLLVTFLWTFGLPRPLATPALPVPNHLDYVNDHKDPLIPVSGTHATAQAHATGVPQFDEDGGRWDDDTPHNATAISNGTTATTATEEPDSYVEVLQQPTHDVADFCKDVRGAQHVMVVIRTSKAELKDKLPTHLKNLLECVPNFAVFSDHAGEIDGYKVHNSLESISSETKRGHGEFREYQLMHADAEHKPNPGKTKDLDKWKFLPMVYKAYHLRPSARFFVFIEADTSLSWTNLLQWVGRLDYRIPYHSGSPTFMSSTQISQRGSGIMLSQGALRRYAKSYDELYTSKWEAQVARECCGELVLSMALNDAHVEFYPAWPMLQDERPNTLDYTKKLWCAPAIAWHRVNGDDLSGMWEKEKAWTEARGWEVPYLHRDAFHDHVESHLEAQKDNWDNFSEDAKIVAPQGRQQQIKEEAERRKKHEEEEQQKQAAEKQRMKEQEQAENDMKAMKELLSKESDQSDGSTAAKPDPNTRPETPPKMKLKTDTRKPPPPPKPTPSTITNSAQGINKREDKKGQEEKPDWGRLAETQGDAGDSSEHCQKACLDTPDCLQWRYTTAGDGECHLGAAPKLGEKADGNAKWVSGWFKERIAAITEKWECKAVNWKFHQ